MKKYWWYGLEHHDHAALSNPIRGDIKLVSVPKSNSPSAILNGLADNPDITERVFAYLKGRWDLVSLHLAVQPLRQSGQLGRLLPGFREIPFLKQLSWTAKLRLLPPSRKYANGTDKPTREAIEFIRNSKSPSSVFIDFTLNENSTYADLTHFLEYERVHERRERQGRLDRHLDASLRIARLADDYVEQMRVLEQIRKRHEIDDAEQRKRLMAEECAISDAVGERIDAIREGRDPSACAICFDGRRAIDTRSFIAPICVNCLPGDSMLCLE
ncbi:hypothetical protein HDK90DRAFT_480908 [Phyllosticta capitalensis]|uniref:Uncharacterized protein n=1 Tax=Phyllosticta capitalensis TaxID=121624 RepID=A0ABR1YXD3_9PEZI